MNLRAIDQVRKDCLEQLGPRAEMLSALKGETLAVTGGTGFVGTWIAEMIAALNDEYQFGTKLVLVSRSVEAFKKSYPHLSNRKDIELIKSDVRHTFETPKSTNWLIHAAANPDNRFHSTWPVETMTVISQGTESVLRSVDRCSNFKMLLNLSSALVYGPQPMDLDKMPETFRGSPELNSISTVYSEAKRYAETLCTAFRNQARIPVINVRPFAFMGPYQSLTSPWAVNNFIHDAISKKSIRILGDGQTIRSYLYGSDMAFALLKILVSGQSGMNYNLGSEEAVTLETLAKSVASHFTPNPEVIFSVNTPGLAKPSRLVPSMALVAKDFGLQPKVNLKAALQKTIDWYRQTQE